MVLEMKKAKKVIGIELEQTKGWIYVFPSGECRGVDVDYLCYCISPYLDEGIKGIEQKLEILMMPTASSTDWWVFLTFFSEFTLVWILKIKSKRIY
jgi:hypothetical protein